jgi:hypothetical protein
MCFVMLSFSSICLSFLFYQLLITCLDLINRSPLLSVDSVVSELLAEEIRLQSYSEKGIPSASNSSVLAVPSKPFSNHQNKSYTRVGFDECSFCK